MTSKIEWPVVTEPTTDQYISTSSKYYSHILEPTGRKAIISFCTVIPPREVLEFCDAPNWAKSGGTNLVENQWKNVLNESMNKMRLMHGDDYYEEGRPDYAYPFTWLLVGQSMFLQNPNPGNPDETLVEYLNNNEAAITAEVTEHDIEKQHVLHPSIWNTIPTVSQYRKWIALSTLEWVNKKVRTKIISMNREEFLNLVEAVPQVFVGKTTATRFFNEVFEKMKNPLRETSLYDDWPKIGSAQERKLLFEELSARSARGTIQTTGIKPKVDLSVGKDPFQGSFYGFEDSKMNNTITRQTLWLLELMNANFEKFTPASIHGFMKLINKSERMVEKRTAGEYIEGFDRIREDYELSVVNNTTEDFFCRFAFMVEMVAVIRMRNTYIHLPYRKEKKTPPVICGIFKDFTQFVDMFMNIEGHMEIPFSIIETIHFATPRGTHYIEVEGSISEYTSDCMRSLWEDDKLLIS